MTNVLSSALVTPIGTTLPADWKLAPLGELCSKIGSGATPRGGAAAYTQGGTTFIRSQNVFDHRFSHAGIAFINSDSAGKLANVEVRPRDVLLNITGDGDTIARCCVVPEEVLPARVSQHVLILRADMGLVPEFLQRYLSHPSMREFMLNHNSGGSRRALTKKLAEGFKIVLPPIDEQQAIAEVLGALDDKITANTTIAATSEALLQASYLGLIGAAPVRRVLVESVVRRITPKRKVAKSDLLAQGEFPVFDQSDLGFLGYLNGEGFLEASADEPILYFGDHTCKLRIASERFTVGPNTIPFSGSGIPSLTLYCALNNVQNHEEYKRHWQLLMTKEVSIPTAHDAAAFAQQHGHFLGLHKSLRLENSRLVATRDALLPQLMSGELRVKDAETVLEEAGV